MLSLTCFSLNNTLLIQPSLLAIQPLQSPKTRSNSHGSSDVDLSGTQLATHFVDSGVLALWLRSCYRAKEVKRIHAVALKCLRNSVTYVNNNMISAYLKLGQLIEARKVFDGMPERNVVSWTAMINGYISFGLDDEALRLFSDFIENGVVANSRTLVCVLNLCSKRLDFELGRQLHARVVKGNWRNLILDSAVVSFYAQCGELTGACNAFDQMAERDVVCWTTMITAFSQQGHEEEAFGMLSQMLAEGFLPNEFTACAVLKACGEKKALRFGKQLHGAIVKKMYKDDVFIGSSLVDMYAKCGEILDSRKVFNRMRKRNTVTWTSIIAGYARKGLGEEAISLFQVMKQRRVISNNLTVVSILKACGSIRALLTGQEVHAQIIKNRIQSNEYIGSTLVWFYCKCGEFHIASKVLEQIPLRSVVSWTAMISGYAGLGHEPEALEFLKEMMEEGVEPNAFTCSSALKACANLDAILQGKLIHSFANKTPASSNVFVGSALIYMYSKCGYLSDAIQVFDSMPERNLISWKTMILGYARNGRCREALKLMYRMQAEGIEMDDYIFTSVMGACGDVEWNMEPSSKHCLLS
ncbi:pentatricopeptide repeat-containing protein At4g18520, chloroplastic isoform X1 [Hevea brasiliensis]|uniref:pentatricopeptide repeat-containing protein At4g18520, chloroplastic isoform X1 n=1 Tax=Hevea brasiliensis TaxID=3981 RepID=UPI000B785EB4|nr:pentatricopeptide repeat-containing protein At4g18520, chloroplastic isoform X1 [Hevea brasiliensis]